jgi:hypothetical protein
VIAARPDIRYRGSNAELIRSRAPEVILSGPAGTGKSLAALHKLHRCAVKYPGMRALIARKTREALTQSVLVTLEDKVLSRAWYHRIAAGMQRRVRQSYRYPNGSEIVVGGLDKPSKVMSTEFDLIYVNEATETAENDWESLSSRLRNGRMPYQQILGDTNPDAPTHWIRQRANGGNLLLLESRHEDNPEYFGPDGWTDAGERYLARLERLTGVRYLRLRKGVWAGAEGQIYDEWDEVVHHIDRFDIPADWMRHRSIDFGYTNPFVCHWWAVDHDGRSYLYRELYGTGRLVSDWAGDIAVLSHGERIEWTVADHDAEDRATLDACGIPTLPAHKAVKPGIEAVQKRLRKADDGKPRLFMLKGCTVSRDPRLVEAKKPASTAEEIGAYIWAPALSNRAPKEEPRKVDDHGCFPAGTIVSTNLGDIPIEQVRDGDRVLTRYGWYFVAAAGISGFRKWAYRVKFSDGLTLTGTPDHPIWTENRGWVRLDALQYGDIMDTVEYHISSVAERAWEETKKHLLSSSSTVSSIVDTRIRPTERIGLTSQQPAAVASIGPSGSTTTGRSRTDGTSTTRTATRSTMISAISNAGRSPIISASIPPSITMIPPIGTKSSNISGESGPLPANGTGRRKAGPGIGSTGGGRGRGVGLLGRLASNAARRIRRGAIAGRSDFVRPTADPPHGGDPGSTTWSVPVPFVRPPSRSTPTLDRGPAPVFVVSVSEREPCDRVYNLTVDGPHEYYANGILVSNCDALRYFVAQLDDVAGVVDKVGVW